MDQYEWLSSTKKTAQRRTLPLCVFTNHASARSKDAHQRRVDKQKKSGEGGARAKGGAAADKGNRSRGFQGQGGSSCREGENRSRGIPWLGVIPGLDIPARRDVPELDIPVLHIPAQRAIPWLGVIPGLLDRSMVVHSTAVADMCLAITVPDSSRSRGHVPQRQSRTCASPA